jgi:phage baseplate assembly protein W
LSLEIQAGFPCPHLIIEEPVSLGDDNVTLQPKAAISGAGSVRILANDTLYIPPGGLYSQAVLVADTAGPYNIARCSGASGPDANLLTITTNGGTVSVRMPEGARVLLSAVQRALRLSGANDLVKISDRNSALTLIESGAIGGESFIRVSGRAAAALGFVQLGARGTMLYPPWGLVSQLDINPASYPAGVRYVPSRYPKFQRPVQGNPSFKVTYAAMPERCPRCSASYVENDYRFDYLGDIVTIADENLLYQACLKAILTVQGSNPYHLKYGSKIMTRVGQKLAGASASLIKEDVVSALNQVKSLQTQQRSRGQNVSSKEMLYSVQTVDVRPSAEDPTVYFVDVVVRNASNQAISVTIVYSVPGAVALTGTNGLSLGLERTGLSTDQSRTLLDG